MNPRAPKRPNVVRLVPGGNAEPVEFGAGHPSQLSRSRVRLVSRLSAGFLIGGGIWLALARAR